MSPRCGGFNCYPVCADVRNSDDVTTPNQRRERLWKQRLQKCKTTSFSTARYLQRCRLRSSTPNSRNSNLTAHWMLPQASAAAGVVQDCSDRRQQPGLRKQQKHRYADNNII